MSSESLHVCTSDGSCFCEEPDSTKLSDDALDVYRGEVRERLELARAKLAEIRRQRRELLGLKQITREQAAELVRISEGRAPNYQRLAPVAEEKPFEHFMPIVKPDPFAKKLAMSDDESVVQVPEAEAPKKRQKLIEVWR